MPHVLKLLCTTTAFALLAPAAALAVPVEVTNPIPQPIAVGARIGIADFLTIPASAPTQPTARIQYIQPVGDRRNRLVVNDTRGQVWMTDRSGAAPTLYMDLNSAYLPFQAAFGDPMNPPNDGQTGLNGITFHPNFDGNPDLPGYGKFYAAFSAVTDRPASFLDGDNASHDSVLAEFTADPTSAIYTEIAPPRELLRVGKVFLNHNINNIGFNPTAEPGSADYGNLYVSLGDSGAGNDPLNYAQDLENPRGKVLRIVPEDPDGAGAATYGIPADNPFVGRAGLDEIYTSGHRNLQHFSWDRATGTLYAAEFGQDNVEEINILTSGGNYGWQLREGAFQTAFAVNGDKSMGAPIFTLDGVDATDGFVYPIAQYDHDEGQGVSSAYVYNGTAVPELVGKLIFTENVLGRLFYVNLADVMLGSQAEVFEFSLDYLGMETTLLDLVGHTEGAFMGNPRVNLRLGIDELGELYLLTKGQGRIFRLVSLQPTAVPEPAMLALLALGVGGIALARRRGTSVAVERH